MLLSERMIAVSRFAKGAFIASFLGLFSACQFQPLYGNQSSQLGSQIDLSAVEVSQVNSRVAQQVRNHLLFLLNGGVGTTQKTHEARIRVTWSNRQLATVQGVRDNIAGTVTVISSYDLIRLSDGQVVASGSRQADASYDRAGQVYANKRAERDAENRAAKETAESLRLAIAADLSKS